jgi:hypothetical protein
VYYVTVIVGKNMIFLVSKSIRAVTYGYLWLHSACMEGSDGRVYT